jgi:uncharacterized membrane protein YedE/YeeE
MHLAENIDLQSGIMGGLLIGLTSSGYLYYTGRLTGLSGIVEGILLADAEDTKGWTLAYFMGLLSSGAVLYYVRPESFGSELQGMTLTPLAMAVAGIVTGFGTRLANGCTSGHGICGLSRRSPRSLAAVLTFMCTGALSAYVSRNTFIADLIRHPVGITFEETAMQLVVPSLVTMTGVATLFNKRFFLNQMFFGSDDDKPSNRAISYQKLQDYAISFISAFTFGIGLGYAGMCNPERVLKFLDFTGKGGFDPSLMGVMGGGVLFNLVTFHVMAQDESKNIKLDAHPENMKVDWRLIIGSAIFGLGWGLGGMCPGPGIVSLGGSIRAASIFIPSLMLGMVTKDMSFGKGLSRLSSSSKPEKK